MVLRRSQIPTKIFSVKNTTNFFILYLCFFFTQKFSFNLRTYIVLENLTIFIIYITNLNLIQYHTQLYIRILIYYTNREMSGIFIYELFYTSHVRSCPRSHVRSHVRSCPRSHVRSHVRSYTNYHVRSCPRYHVRFSKVLKYLLKFCL